jgi:hypothetical protein
MTGMLASQNFEEVQWVYYWDWAMVVLVIMSVLGTLHFGIVVE